MRLSRDTFVRIPRIESEQRERRGAIKQELKLVSIECKSYDGNALPIFYPQAFPVDIVEGLQL